MKKIINALSIITIILSLLIFNTSNTYATNKISINKTTISNISSKNYTGKQIKPDIYVKYGKKLLKEGTDYKIIYGSNKLPGKGKIKITGKGRFTGSKTVYFSINDVNHLKYNTHIQNIGWQSYVTDGKIAGTFGKSLRLEGIHINLVKKPYSGSIQYRTHVQNIGWQDWKSNGELSGTSGRSLRLEAIQIKLAGNISRKYDIYYRVHCQNFGWLGWAKNGQSAGSAGYSYRLEAIQIQLIRKGSPAPENTGNSYYEKNQTNEVCSHQYIRKTKTMLMPEQGHYEKKKVGTKNIYQMTATNKLKKGIIVKPMITKDEEGIIFELDGDNDINNFKDYMKRNNCIAWKQIKFVTYYDKDGKLHSEWQDVTNTYHASKVISTENIYKNIWIVDIAEKNEKITTNYICKKCGKEKSDVMQRIVTYDYIKENVYGCNFCGYPLYTFTNHGTELLNDLYIHPLHNKCNGGGFHSEIYVKGYCAFCGGSVSYRQCDWTNYRKKCCKNTTLGEPKKVVMNNKNTGWEYYQVCSCGKNEIMINQDGKGIVYAGLK